MAGQHDLAWVWLGSPTRRYPHGALGWPLHACLMFPTTAWADLAMILAQPGQRPTIVLLDMTRRTLHALRWYAPGRQTAARCASH